jgi:hypothetical protein
MQTKDETLAVSINHQNMKYIIIMTSIVLFLIGESETEPKLLSFIAKGPSSKKEYLEYESKLKGNLNIT